MIEMYKDHNGYKCRMAQSAQSYFELDSRLACNMHTAKKRHNSK